MLASMDDTLCTIQRQSGVLQRTKTHFASYAKVKTVWRSTAFLEIPPLEISQGGRNVSEGAPVRGGAI
jgi:hypothetical protein